MKECPNCRMLNQNENHFCIRCGSNIFRPEDAPILGSQPESVVSRPEPAAQPEFIAPHPPQQSAPPLIPAPQPFVPAPAPYTPPPLTEEQKQRIEEENNLRRQAKAERRARTLPIGFLNFIYAFILFFMLAPVVFPGNFWGKGYGKFGYGIRQQITAFQNLKTTSEAGAITVNFFWISLIAATIIAIGFTIAALVIVNYYGVKKREINYRLLKILNLFVFLSMSFIFLVTCFTLTFTFICAFLLAFYALLINLKPDVTLDFFIRKENENRNSSVNMFFFMSVIFTLFFAPLYSFGGEFHATVVGQNTSFVTHSVFTLLLNMKANIFVGAISLVVMLLVLAMFLYMLIAYLINAKTTFIVMNIGLAISIILTILIGAYVYSTTAGIELNNFNFYFMLTSMFVVIAIYLVQKTLDWRQQKKSVGEPTAEKS